MKKEQIDFKDAIGLTIEDIRIYEGMGKIVIEFTSTFSVLNASGSGDFECTTGIIDTCGHIRYDCKP